MLAAFATVLKVGAIHFLKWGGQLWSPLLKDIVEIEKGKENDQVEVAASLHGAVKKVETPFCREGGQGVYEPVAQDPEGEGGGECRPTVCQTCNIRSRGHLRELVRDWLNIDNRKSLFTHRVVNTW